MLNLFKIPLWGASVLLCCGFAASTLQAQTHAAPSKRSVEAAVRAYAGRSSGSYFMPSRGVGDQLVLGLAVPDQAAPMEGGLTLVSGCRWHSCMEKSAVVIDRSNRVVSAGLIHYKCARTRTGATRCSSSPTITLIVKKRNISTAGNKTILAWAKKLSPAAFTERRYIN